MTISALSAFCFFFVARKSEDVCQAAVLHEEGEAVLSIPVIAVRADLDTMLLLPLIPCWCSQGRCVHFWVFIVKRPSINYRESRGKLIKELKDTV